MSTKCNDRTTDGLCGLVQTESFKCRDPLDPEKCVVRQVTKGKVQYKVIAAVCCWCGNEVDRKELVKAYEKRDNSSVELSREPFPGSNPVDLCQRCAE
jgi:hypothetical protein